MSFTQIRLALNLSADQAAEIAVACAYERGVNDASDRILSALTCDSLAAAMAHRAKLTLPDVEKLLLDSASDEVLTDGD